jgi:hypothetical protein
LSRNNLKILYPKYMGTAITNIMNKNEEKMEKPYIGVEVL